jgi:DNA-binding response OmpR family regulator
MLKETILLISHDAELCNWFKAQVLHLTGFACDEAADLATARARIAAQQPRLMIVDLSAQMADGLAFIAECEIHVSAIAILPERSPDLIEAALAHGVSSVLIQPLDAVPLQRRHARRATRAGAAGTSAAARTNRSAGAGIQCLVHSRPKSRRAV